MTTVFDHWQKEAKRVAQGIRSCVLEYTLRNNGGYLSQACSSAEIFAALYTKVLQLAPLKAPLQPGKFPGVPGKAPESYERGYLYHGPHAPHLDRFYLSPTHYSLVLYAALVEVGRMAPEGLHQFNQDGGIVEMIGAEHSPGMEVMTGSLGQGISQAAGIALARKLHNESGKNWVFMSDGELQPGQVWEAIQAMVFYGLDNMGLYVDINGQQCDGKTQDVMRIEPLEDRFAAFGCTVRRIDGHNLEALVGAAEGFEKGKPLVVLCDTIPWNGIDILQKRAPKFHYIRFKDEADREEYHQIWKKLRGL